MRQLTIKRSKISRVSKWLRIEHDFQGFILRDGKTIGYKQSADNNSITFVINDGRGLNITKSN